MTEIIGHVSEFVDPFDFPIPQAFQHKNLLQASLGVLLSFSINFKLTFAFLIYLRPIFLALFNSFISFPRTSPLLFLLFTLDLLQNLLKLMGSFLCLLLRRTERKHKTVTTLYQLYIFMKG